MHLPSPLRKRENVGWFWDIHLSIIKDRQMSDTQTDGQNCNILHFHRIMSHAIGKLFYVHLINEQSSCADVAIQYIFQDISQNAKWMCISSINLAVRQVWFQIPFKPRWESLPRWVVSPSTQIISYIFNLYIH